jgi:glutamyl-tRNA synthetase
MTVRVRVAPAPSGSIHIGTARTALYNWLFARHHGGTFILRIEDTDPSRTFEEHYKTVQEDLLWLGLDWDEGPGVGGEFGPYLQSERLDIYKETAERLLEKGVVFKCYCTPEELKERKQAALEAGRTPRYDRRCLNLTDAEQNAFMNEGRPATLRIRRPDEGSTIYKDVVLGEITFDHAELDDIVVVRSDGRPLYNLAVTADDALMQMTHVIRGMDLQSSTPYQILLHQALGNPLPIYGHIPLVVGPGGKKLSKRFGGDEVETFRSLGYLPEAMVNYLALLGWGMADQTIISRDELIEKFELEKVHASPGSLDPDKLDWMNGEYIRGLDPDDLAERLMPWLTNAGLIQDESAPDSRDKVRAVAPLVQTRIDRLEEAPDLVRGIFIDPEIDPAAAEKALKEEWVPELLRKAKDRIGSLDDWSRDAIDKALRELMAEMDLKPRKGFMPFYVAVHGSTVGAPILESIELIGKEKFLERVDRALALTQA